MQSNIFKSAPPLALFSMFISWVSYTVKKCSCIALILIVYKCSCISFWVYKLLLRQLDLTWRSIILIYCDPCDHLAQLLNLKCLQNIATEWSNKGQKLMPLRLFNKIATIVAISFYKSLYIILQKSGANWYIITYFKSLPL